MIGTIHITQLNNEFYKTKHIYKVLKRKKIILRFKGGLGNQLFIYSFYLYLKSKVRSEILIDKSSSYSKLLFGNRLNNESFVINQIDKNLKYLRSNSIFLGLVGKFFRFFIKNSNILQKITKIKYINSENYKKIIKSINNLDYDVFYIDGYFQSNFISNFGTNKIKKYFKHKDFKVDKEKILLCYTFYKWREKHYNKDQEKLIKIIKKIGPKNILLVSSRPEKLRNWLNVGNIKILGSFKKKNPIRKLKLLKNYEKFIINDSTFYYWAVKLSSRKFVKIIGDKSKFHNSL